MDYENLERELVDNPDQVLAWAQTDQQAATPVLIDVLWRAPPDPPEILEYRAPRLDLRPALSRREHPRCAARYRRDRSDGRSTRRVPPHR